MDRTTRKASLVVLVSAALCAPAASAEVIYKLIHKDGKITYSESEPKEFDGQVVRIGVDPNANTVSLPKPAPGAMSGDGRSVGDGVQRRRTETDPSGGRSPADRVQDAKEKLEAARKALQDARDNPGDTDIRWIGNAGGGTRAQPTEEYQRRLAKLEDGVRKAEEDLKVAEKAN